ncbi:MAG: hypothetical protein ING75_09475 [Rhodocyclaceae bacterium]|nr:hypothetical protein [Rhodocyclaceae bacterium]
MKSIEKFALAVSLALFLSGCSSLRNGGAPPDLPGDDSDFQELAKAYSVEKFVNAAKDSSSTPATRNALIVGRMALIDTNFRKWTSDVRRDRRHGDAAVDLTLVGLGIAGTATAAVRSKTNLAAAIAGIAAGKAIIDKNYYFEKTLPALFEAMEASRLTVQKKIRQGMAEDLDEYPILQAKQDLDEYMEAGNFDAAIAKVGEVAATAKGNAQAAIAVLPDVTPDDVALRTKLRKTIQTLPAEKIDSAKKVIAKYDANEPAAQDIDGARSSLMKLYKANKSPEKMKALVAALASEKIDVK